MTDWTKEEEEAFNEVEKQSNLGKQILREMGQPYYFEKREWVGLTDEEINSVRYKRDWTAPWTDTTFARAIEAKLKEKNT